ncbi:MAG TPA: aspartate-semialdehyde dehydrogenase, partial [Tabrizicola sp.]|nr:aspartate-semialdehyde dehydrogenase [Tabrizicola sp.]
MGYKVVVAGATGNVGREMLNILAEREFPVDEITALASRKSLGTEVSFGDKTLKCKDLDTFDFTGWDIALFAVGSEATKIYAPRAAAAGCIVIDNSSLYRYDPDVPLIVPEVNAEAIHGYAKKNIIANPNCSTAQMVVALKPLHDRAKITRVVVSTYQSVSGAGKEGMDELWNQTKAVYNPTDDVPPKKFSKQIAFNVIPHIDVFLDSGETKEEWKMVAETKKILDPKIKVTATCVRVPVFVGHSEAINIETEEFLDWQEAQDILRESPGIMLVDKREPGGYITPIECVGEFATYVSRVRQ